MIDFARLQQLINTQASEYNLTYPEAVRIVFTAYNVVMNNPEIIVTDNYNHDFSEQEIEELRKFVVDHPDSFAEQLILEIHAGYTLTNCEFIDNRLIQAIVAKFPVSYTELLVLQATQDMLNNLVEECKEQTCSNNVIFLHAKRGDDHDNA